MCRSWGSLAQPWQEPSYHLWLSVQLAIFPGNGRVLRAMKVPQRLFWITALFHFPCNRKQTQTLYTQTHKEQVPLIPHSLESLFIRESNTAQSPGRKSCFLCLICIVQRSTKPSQSIFLGINEMVHIMPLAQRPTQSKRSTVGGKALAKRLSDATRSSSDPFIVLFKVLWTFCIRKKPAARGPALPETIKSSPRSLHCRWRGQEGVWLLLQEGGGGASGSKVPWGQVAADSHKWHLDRGGRNKRSLPLPPGNGLLSHHHSCHLSSPRPPPDVAANSLTESSPTPGHVKTSLPAQHSSGPMYNRRSNSRRRVLFCFLIWTTIYIWH